MNNILYSYIGKENFSEIDIISILPKFKFESSDDSNLPREKKAPLTDKNQSLFWQKYPPSLAFARNFYVNNKELCQTILQKLKNVQTNLTPRNKLHLIFKKEDLKAERVNLIKVSGNVQTHKDYTRNYALTIGLHNCDNYQTYIYNTKKMDDIMTSKKLSYTVKQNEVYISNFHYCHGVDSLIDDNSIRYVLTYNMQFIE